MGKASGRDDFEWVYSDQPHTSRRKEILGEKLKNLSIIFLDSWSEKVKSLCVCGGVLTTTYLEL